LAIITPECRQPAGHDLQPTLARRDERDRQTAGSLGATFMKDAVKLLRTDHIKNTWTLPKVIGAAPLIVIAVLAVLAGANIWFSDGKMFDRVATCQTLLCPQIIGPVIGAVRILKHETSK
jgi:hypothetical protein